MSSDNQQAFRIAQWTVKPGSHQLIDTDGNIERDIAPSLMSLLLYLVSHQGKVISRDELIENVWSGSVISDESVSRSIGMLRKLLDDSAKSPLFIKTISKQGYQFLVQPIALTADEPLATAKVDATTKTTTKYAIVFVASCVVLLIVMSWFGKGIQPPQNQLGHLFKVPLSANQKVNRQPRFSPDGRFIVSAGKSKGINTLELRDLVDGSEKTLFSSNEEVFYMPSFSPSGEELALIRKLKGEGKENRCDLLIYIFKTSQSRKVADCSSIFEANLSWTADSNYLVGTQFFAENATVGLAKIDVHKGTMTTIKSPERANLAYLFPRLSPQNGKIAFVYFDGRTNQANIGLYDFSNNQITKLLPRFNRVQQVVWGENDAEIYFSDIAYYNAGIWHLNLDTQELTLIYNEMIRDFDIHPQTGRFVVNINRTNINIWQASLDKDGSVKNSVELDSSVDEMFPSLSHDGQKLAYVANHNGFENVWIKDLQSGEVFQLTHFKIGNLSNIRWSKNDLRLAVSAVSEQGNQLFVVDVAEPYPVVQSIAQVTYANWHDNDTELTLVYQQDYKSGAYLYNINTQDEIKLLDQTIYAIDTIEKDRYLVQKVKGLGIYEVRSNTKETQWLPYPELDNASDWQVRDDYITFFNTQKGKLQDIRVVHLPSQTEQDGLAALLSQKLYRPQVVLDNKNKRYFYVKNDDKRMDLFLIKPQISNK